jgi:hypothetical protein
MLLGGISQSPSQPSNPDGSARVSYNSLLTTNVKLPKLVGMGKIVLMAPGSMNHHSDMYARYIELEQEGGATNMTGGILSIVCTMPSEGVAPRGYYMVFALTAGGVPSHAGWVQIV